MQNVFWLIPGKLAGRTGPNVDPWNAKNLKEGGIDAVLSVNGGNLVDVAALEASGIAYACIPFSWNAPPIPGDLEICLEALPKAFAFVQRNIEAGKAVMIHCTSGKDRTGLLMSYYLMRTQGLSVDEAILEVRRVRPIALSAAGWDEFGREILRRGKESVS
jgi:protein-tyrosine phosphatase